MSFVNMLLACFCCAGGTEKYVENAPRASGAYLNRYDYQQSILVHNPAEIQNNELVAYKNRRNHFIYAEVTHRSIHSGVALIKYQSHPGLLSYSRNIVHSVDCKCLRKLPS